MDIRYPRDTRAAHGDADNEQFASRQQNRWRTEVTLDFIGQAWDDAQAGQILREYGFTAVSVQPG
jgi:hypothetical protein